MVTFFFIFFCEKKMKKKILTQKVLVFYSEKKEILNITFYRTFHDLFCETWVELHLDSSTF
jgi:hypothetical protein